jgi:hypothetical protein
MILKEIKKVIKEFRFIQETSFPKVDNKYLGPKLVSIPRGSFIGRMIHPYGQHLV